MNKKITIQEARELYKTGGWKPAGDNDGSVLYFERETEQQVDPSNGADSTYMLHMEHLTVNKAAQTATLQSMREMRCKVGCADIPAKHLYIYN